MASDRLAISLDVSAIPPKPAGAGRYVVEISRALGRLEEVSLTLVSRRGDAERWREVAPASRVVDIVPRSRPARVGYEQVLLGGAVSRLRDPLIRVHHGPHYTLPHRLEAVGSVVTIHDMTFFDHPEWHEATKVPFFKHAIRRSAAKADVTICVSQTTADRFEALMAPKGPVLVAPHGVDHSRFRPVDASDEIQVAADSEALGRAGLDPSRPYILHLGTIEPRKSVDGLVSAFGIVSGERRDLEFDLVLAGLNGWGAERVDDAIAASRYADRIRKLGYVDDELVPALIRRATVMAYPSKEEGFGLPTLEAMACGTTVVTSAGTAMAEFAGTAAFVAPSGDVEALAGSLGEALSAGDGELATRRADGIDSASRYTWEQAAAVHLHAYRLAIP